MGMGQGVRIRNMPKSVHSHKSVSCVPPSTDGILVLLFDFEPSREQLGMIQAPSKIKSCMGWKCHPILETFVPRTGTQEIAHYPQSYLIIH